MDGRRPTFAEVFEISDDTEGEKLDPMTREVLGLSKQELEEFKRIFGQEPERHTRVWDVAL